jgi:MFS superfamily sulfate permease-like transporter
VDILMIALLRAKADGLWTRAHIRNNVLAGVVVGVVALPLAMAFAIASGARPEQGLYTAIVAAAMTSLFGGTRTQISGPTGAFVAVLAIITAQHGIAGLQIATLTAGMILLAFGFGRLGAGGPALSREITVAARGVVDDQSCHDRPRSHGSRDLVTGRALRRVRGHRRDRTHGNQYS